jgi:hypothetical protein
MIHKWTEDRSRRLGLRRALAISQYISLKLWHLSMLSISPQNQRTATVMDIAINIVLADLN